jgi:YVTN family beta-propeller protein
MLAILAAIVLRTAPIAVTPDGTRVVVVNPDSATVSVLDVATRAKIREITTCGRPQTVSVTDARAWIACGEGRVALIDLESLEVVARADVGIEPYGIIANGDSLFVSDTSDAAVLVLDANTLATKMRIATRAYPRGMALHDGRVLVTHFRGGEVTELDAASGAITRNLFTGPDVNLAQSLFIANGRAYLPITRTNTTNLTLRFDTTLFPNVAVLNVASGDHVKHERFAIDTMDQPSNLPIDVAVTASDKMYVVLAGSDDVSVLDVAKRMKVAHVAVGLNPRGIALTPDESLAFITNSLGGTASVIDTATDSVVATIATTSIPLAPLLLRGKILFNSAATTALSKDRWISCATCHFEGGTDGRTWNFPDGPRNTQPLFGVAATTPLHWSGDLDELHDVESTIRTIQSGDGLAPGDANCTPACNGELANAHRSYDLDALAAFMASLRAPRRPAVVPSDAVARGEVVFARADCASCHVPPLYIDRQKHDVGTATSSLERKGGAFDTPSLRGLYDTAPYFHDGTAVTLGDVLDRHATGITPEEREDLIAFLRSLPYPESKRRAAAN